MSDTAQEQLIANKSSNAAENVIAPATTATAPESSVPVNISAGVETATTGSADMPAPAEISAAALTPLMRQYHDIKNKFPDTLLFFQVGDFYELFFSDAHKASAFLGIMLTKRGTVGTEPIPLCGVPVHTVDHYILKLVRGGFRVALCDQLTKPQPGKIVERGVTRVFTPGTLTDMHMLQEKSASYIAAFCSSQATDFSSEATRFSGETTRLSSTPVPLPNPKKYAENRHSCDGTATRGLVFAELLTGQIFVTVLDAQDEKMTEAELARFMPDEILLPATKAGQTDDLFLKKRGYCTTLCAGEFGQHGICAPAPNAKTGKCVHEQSESQAPTAREESIRENYAGQASCLSQNQEPDEHKHMQEKVSAACEESNELHAWITRNGTPAVCAFIAGSPAATAAIGLLYTYLKKNFPLGLEQCKQIFIYGSDDFLILDASTQRNLEITANLHDGTSTHTLLGVLDEASTSMGSRRIKKWLVRPLRKKESVEQRLDAIDAFLAHAAAHEQIRTALKQIGDLERVVGRIALKRAALPDYISLMHALEIIADLTPVLTGFDQATLVHLLLSKITDFTDLYMLLRASLNDNTEQPFLIKPGYHAELDRLRSILENSARAVIELEHREQEALGIASLKIRYNKAHGYGIEITKTHLALVPAHYIRLQTLTNRERYTIQDLKDLEYDIQRARAGVDELEQEVFQDICTHVFQAVHALKKCADALAHLDALAGLAQCAHLHNYVRPVMTDRRDIMIQNGRHPVVESCMQGQTFIPNDLHLTDQESLLIITGPNMGGKSTYLRQAALICIMAQAGSFVPASRAELPVLDRIFTRIGAADHVAAGKSTFLVEMEEAALICSRATDKSLVILDEVGRGTSTYDGLALARAIIEYIYTHIRARCLFATHYHELTTLTEKYPGMGAYNASSTETAEGVLLLHKIVKGKSDGSFGIEVARQAGLPLAVITRAKEILAHIKEQGTDGW